MKNLSTNNINAAKALGHEPIIILKIDWPSGTRWYADKDLILGDITCEGRISKISNLISQKKQNNVGMVSASHITLLDSDGSLKNIIDNTSIEYASVTIYQHYEGLAKSDLGQLFKGSIAGPITWSEKDRSLSFEIETRLKDQEYGFSVDFIPPADPNNIYALPNPSVPYLNPDAVNKPWPLCFGSVVHVPALLFKSSPNGSLKFPFRGPRDPDVQPPTLDPYKDDNHLYVQDGDGAYFPQNTLIQLEVDGYIFEGRFGTAVVGTGTQGGDSFTVTQANLPKYENVLFGTRDTNDPDNILANVAWLLHPVSIVNNWCLYQDLFGGTSYFRCIRQDGLKVEFDKSVVIPSNGQYKLLDSGDKLLQVAKHGRAGWNLTSEYSTSVPGASSPNFGAATNQRFLQAVDVLSRVTWTINAGASVHLWSPNRQDVWVANLIPSTTIVAVYADKGTKDGVTQLIPIPTSYYTVTQTPITITNLIGDVTVTPTIITFDPPLREYDGQRWGNQIYVTLKSSVGPNTSDVIKYLLQTYSSIPVDSTSFTAIASLITKYPCGFTRFDKGDVISLCEQISYLARLGLIIDDGTISLRYLSKAPSSVIDINESLTSLQSIEMNFTLTENIYTRLEADYVLTYHPAQRFKRKYIYEANVSKYGLRKRSIDVFIYNIPSCVEKSVNFWGTRDSNSWRTFSAKLALESEILEIFDGLNIAYSDTGLFNTSSITGEVSKYDLNFTPKNRLNSVEVWLPSIAGTTSVTPGAYLDDSADTTPGDVTSAYLPLPSDLRLADEESKFRVITKILADSSPVPAIVTGEVPNLDLAGNPDPAQPIAVVVDQYANGYDQPATSTSLKTLPVDPNNVPSVGDHVVTSMVNQQAYTINTGSGNVISVAKIVNISGAPTSYQVDIYGLGFSNPATKTAVNAMMVDLSSTNFAINDHVVVFIAGAFTWIISSKPYSQVSTRLLIPGRITGITGEGGVYTWKEVDKPGGLELGDAATLNAKEFTGSTNITFGTDVMLVQFTPGNYYFFYPLGACS